jgi:hypothetical protein
MRDAITSNSQIVFERISEAIKEFQFSLNDQEEVGIYLVSIPSGKPMHVERVEKRGPEIIAFHGVNEHGMPMLLLQHYTQTNLLLSALPKLGDTARRIGFQLEGD